MTTNGPVTSDPRTGTEARHVCTWMCMPSAGAHYEPEPGLYESDPVTTQPGSTKHARLNEEDRAELERLAYPQYEFPRIEVASAGVPVLLLRRVLAALAAVPAPTDEGCSTACGPDFTGQHVHALDCHRAALAAAVPASAPTGETREGR